MWKLGTAVVGQNRTIGPENFLPLSGHLHGYGKLEVMFRVIVTCEGIAATDWPDAVADVAEEFKSRPWVKVVDCHWDDNTLVLVAESDSDRRGDALADEFSDTIAEKQSSRSVRFRHFGCEGMVVLCKNATHTMEHDGMENTRLDRRLLLMAMGAISAGAPLGRASEAAGLSSAGRVLNAGGGEHLVHFRDGGDIFIFVGADTGTDTVALGTQQIKARGGIPVHRHLHMEEAFYVIDGSGECLLDDVPHPVSRGASIFIPRNTWHGFKTPTDDLHVLWIMAPGGLDGFFRETCSPPGASPKELSADQIRRIAKKYDIEFR